jgi:subtilisin-like proprotein convertase family protein
MSLSSLLRAGAVGAAVLGAAGVASAQGGSVVISQVYGGGGFLTTGPKYDLVELFNRTNAPINLAGWSVQVGLTSAATSWGVVPLTGTIPARGYYLVRTGQSFDATVGYDLTFDDSANPLFDVSAFTSPNGRVAVVNTTTALTACAQPGTAGVVDLFGWGSGAGCFEGAAGPAGSTGGANPVVPARKGGGCQDTDNNAADFETVTSPTFRNSSSPALTGGVILAATASPNPAGAGGSTTVTVLVQDCGGGTPPTLTSLRGDFSPVGGSATTAFTGGPTTWTATVNIPAAQPSGTYTIALTGMAGSATYQGQLALQTLPAPPANDTCAGALQVFIDQPYVIDNTAATADPIDIGTCNATSTATAGVWFRYDHVGAPVLLRVNETSSQNIATGVWEQATAGAFCPVSGPATVCNAAESFAVPVQGGNTYWILIQNDATTQPTVAMNVTFSLVTPPANDTCAGATVLTLPVGTPVAFAVDNTVASTDQIDPGTCNSVSTATNGVWWRYDAATNGTVLVNETSSQNIATGVWETPTAGALCPTAGPATVCNANEAFSFAVRAGMTYFILMHTDSTAPPTVGVAGTFTFVPPPTNDDCPAAQTLALPGPFLASNLGALAPTDNSPIACTASVAMNNDVWYKWTAPASGTIALSPRAVPGAFSGRLAIYNGGPSPGACPTGGAGLLACNAFASTTVTATQPTASVTAGNVYYFQMASQTAGSTGTALLDFDFAPAAVGACCSGGSCVVKAQGECASGFQGNGTVCVPDSGMVSSYAGGSGPIPDGTAGTSEGVFTDTITVPDSFSVFDVEVDISFGHTFQGDLIMTLTDGARTVFLNNRGRRGAASNNGGGADFLATNTYTWSDAGTQRLFDLASTAVTTVPSGVYLPGGVLGLSRGFKNTFNGAPAAGPWTLRIVDHAAGDTGGVNSWTLRLKRGGASTCVQSSTVCCRGATCTVLTSGTCATTGNTQAGAFSAGAGSACNVAGNERQPCCKADYNKVGGVELLDIFAFLNDWFGNVPYADFNQQNNVDLLDIFAFLNAWFAGGC